MNLLGAGGAVFCPAGAGENARAADFAAAEFFRAENGLFQLGLLGQHSAAEPPADQAAGDALQASVIQQQSVAIQEVAAALCKTAHAAELSWRQAEERAIRLDAAVLPGDAGSSQQQRIEHLGVVADVPQGFVLEKEPRKRYIGRRRALRRELAKSFHLTSYPIHQSIHFCVD